MKGQENWFICYTLRCANLAKLLVFFTSYCSKTDLFFVGDEDKRVETFFTHLGANLDICLLLF